MARTTPSLVKGILLRDYDTRLNPDLQPFIDYANLLVTRVNTVATENGYTLGTDLLEMLERYLAAHSYCMSDQTFAVKKTLSSSATMHGKTGMKLEATKYGQQALTLDYSGSLDEMNSSGKIEFTWLGKREQEQSTYDDRNFSTTGEN